MAKMDTDGIKFTLSGLGNLVLTTELKTYISHHKE